MASFVPLSPLPPAQSTPPLSGIRIVDFTRVVAGPFATQILGDLGAEVIKIENPEGGDDTRAIDPNPGMGGEAPFFMSMNRSKRSIAINLREAEGRRVALDLIATADVLVENFSGSVMRRYQLDYPSIGERFPRLIYCSISGYGRSGRNADAPGYDSTVAADAGVVGINRWADGGPVLGAVPNTDLGTALNAAIGILAALQARARDGRGQHVDVAMFDSALANLSFMAADFLATGRPTQLYQPQQASPKGLFATADGHLVITTNARMFERLAVGVCERPDWLEDARFATPAARRENAEAFLTQLRAVFLSRPTGEWSERCKRSGVPCGAVRTPGEALLSPEAQERELVFGIPHPTAGLAPAIAQPFRFSETPCRYGAPPLLGQHTAEILSDLPGYDSGRIAALAHGGAIALGKTTN
ncbi:MAG TPA: CoA transferase [Novosphingobium sp.]|nr:CoA transferase [Novosphingobium sp.]